MQAYSCKIVMVGWWAWLNGYTLAKNYTFVRRNVLVTFNFSV